ncbi:MAG: hypothetical protein ACFFDN_25495 [Candidatus Hodarchaeota archaeon]
MSNIITCECKNCHYDFELDKKTVNELINGDLKINCPECGVDLKFTKIIEGNFAIGSPI